MSQDNTKSSLFNFETHLVALILWVLSVVGVNAIGGLLMIIACYYILKNERKSTFLRNHVSQALALALISTASSTLLTIISRVIFFRFLYPIYWILSTLVGLFIFALALLGALKAFKIEPITLPIIGFIGDSLNDNIKPN